MTISIYGIWAGLLLALFGAKRIFYRKAFIQRNAFLLDIVLFISIFSLAGIHFFQKRNNVGMVAVGLGTVAIGKYLWDSREIKEEKKEE